jgi:uncharacterized protein YjbI with pentapeptide repeats
LEIINQTPFHVAPINGRLNFPDYSLTFIIKGTFDLKPDQIALPSEEQIYPTGDELYPDDDEMQGSPCYEADFAYFKPRADLIMVGKCHAPGGKPVPACKVSFKVGDRSKSLVVFGDRHWKKNAFGMQIITDPVPFTEMDLRYENSFGGKGYKLNPVGKAYRKEPTGSGKKLRLLPNIEDPDKLINSPRSKQEPAGFGPLGRMWEQRSSKMGTYKGKYLEERWPWFAEDFDWGHFNAAPPEMQLETYLRGDEELYFENLHPEYTQYKSRLPGLRVRCFVNTSTERETEQGRFDEISMVLDTLWVDMEAEKLVLVWRGWTEVLSEDYAEIRHLFIMSEPIDKAPKALDKCHGLFLAALAEYEAEWEMAPEAPEEPVEPETPEEPVAPEEPAIGPPELAADADAEAAAQKEKEALTKKIQAQTAAVFAQLGIDMGSLSPEMQQKTMEQQARIITKLTEGDPEKVMAMERAELETQMKDTFAKMGVDIDNPPPVSAKAKAEQVLFMKALGIDPAMFNQNPQLGKLMVAMPALLPKMGVDPENLSPVIAEAKKQQEKLFKRLGIEMEDEDESIREEKDSATVLTREIVEERAALGESFTDEDLKDLDLSDLDLQGLDFTRANLSGASLQRANLAGAVLQDANLKGADLIDTNLVEADLKGADLSNTNMERVDLTSANLTHAYSKGANLTDAKLTEVILEHADFTGSNLVGANLTGATLTNASLSKANLGKACLKEADFTEADLSESVLNKAALNDAIFEKANLKSAALEEVEAVDSNFSEADLTSTKLSKSDFSGADFSKSILNEADFREAKLQDASVEGSIGLKANFNKADLTRLRASEGCDFTESTFRDANGFESIWHDAVLKDADFSLSKMEGADFTKAILQSADFSAADMKHTRFMKADLKLAKLMYMNLFEGSFEKADLTGADLSGSNMFRVEFLEAVIQHTKMENTNLKMTKLA